MCCSSYYFPDRTPHFLHLQQRWFPSIIHRLRCKESRRHLEVLDQCQLLIMLCTFWNVIVSKKKVQLITSPPTTYVHTRTGKLVCTQFQFHSDNNCDRTVRNLLSFLKSFNAKWFCSISIPYNIFHITTATALAWVLVLGSSLSSVCILMLARFSNATPTSPTVKLYQNLMVKSFDVWMQMQQLSI